MCDGESLIAALRWLALARRKRSGVVCWPERVTLSCRLALEKAVFRSHVVVGDKSQLLIVFWWLALARKMYQSDSVGKTCQ